MMNTIQQLCAGLILGLLALPVQPGLTQTPARSDASPGGAAGRMQATASFNGNIAKLTRENTNFRQELTTGPNSQVVVMSVAPGSDIGDEVHPVDQVLVFVAGRGEAVLNGQKSSVSADSLVFVPAGTRHNFVNTGRDDLKLYTVYSPPEHKPGTIHKTKAEAEAAERK